MVLKLIACNVFMREACLCIARSPHVVDVEFTEVGEHAEPDVLHNLLQQKIDGAAAATKKYDAIVLLYGLCGNAAAGLRARNAPLVIPRAHDCCTILLGSKETFKAEFETNPSRPFTSVGYMERGDYYLRTVDGNTELCFDDPFKAYVDQYGEENAQFIWDSLHPPHLEEANDTAVFIELPETSGMGHVERFTAAAAKEGKQVQILPGSLRLIEQLLAGEWDGEYFLVVPPGNQITGVYDWDQILRAEPAGQDTDPSRGKGTS